MTLFVETRGATAGDALVLLHGAPTNVEWGEALIAALAPGARVLIPHLPGYGRSAAAPQYDWDAVREELGQTLHAHGVSRATLVGFSGGAWRALDLALAGAFEVGGIVCLGATATLSPSERDSFRQFAQALRADVDLRDIVAPRFLARRLGDPTAVRAVRGWLDACSPRALADELDAFAAAPDLLPRLGALTCPVLARSGTLDVACPPAKAQALVAACPKGTLELVDGAAHALLLEDESETVASVRRFICALG